MRRRDPRPLGGGTPDRAAPSIPEVLRRRRVREQRATYAHDALLADLVERPSLSERLRFRVVMARHDLDRLVVTPARWWLLHRLPRPVVYWVMIHAVARGVYDDENVPSVPAMEVVARWGNATERAAAARRHAEASAG